MESVKAQQVTEFMTSMFSSSDPDRAQGTQITVLELLEEGAGRIESELANHHDTQHLTATLFTWPNAHPRT